MAPPKKPGQRGGHKPPLPPELMLSTRGMRARPDVWAAFLALCEIEPAPPRKEGAVERGASEREVFARMIVREADNLPEELKARFTTIRRQKRAEIIAANTTRAAGRKRR